MVNRIYIPRGNDKVGRTILHGLIWERKRTSILSDEDSCSWLKVVVRFSAGNACSSSFFIRGPVMVPTAVLVLLLSFYLTCS